MKILQLAERTYPAKGGVELHTAKISETFVKMGHDVTLAVFNSIDPRDCGFGVTYQKPYLVTRPKKPILPKYEYWNGVKILRFDSMGQIFSYYWSPSMLKWLLTNSGTFDIVHSHTLRFSNNEFAALSKIKTKIPLVITGHVKLKLDNMGTLAAYFDKVYRYTLGRFILKLAEKVIAFDKDYSECYQKLFGVSEEKIRIVPNGIDYSYFDNLPDDKSLRNVLGNPDKVILYIGRFIEYKKPQLLILAFKQVLRVYPNTRLLMIGKDYGLLAYCRKLASELGLAEKVIFFDDASEKIKLQAYRLADVCVVPSEYESFGIVALEAEASGVPLIASKKGGLKYLLEDGRTGLFLQTRAPNEIAEKILYLFNNDLINKNMVAAAKEFAKNYSWDSVAKKLFDVYEEIV